MSNWRKHVTNDTIAIIDRLISKKQHINTLASKKSLYFKITMMLAFLFVAYLFLFSPFSPFRPNENILPTTVAFLKHPFNLAWLIVIAYYYYKYKQIENQKAKANNNFENLRLETIEHLKNTWYINWVSPIRDAISAELERYDINIRYKGK